MGFLALIPSPGHISLAGHHGAVLCVVLLPIAPDSPLEPDEGKIGGPSLRVALDGLPASLADVGLSVGVQGQERLHPAVGGEHNLPPRQCVRPGRGHPAPQAHRALRIRARQGRSKIGLTAGQFFSLCFFFLGSCVGQLSAHSFLCPALGNLLKSTLRRPTRLQGRGILLPPKLEMDGGQPRIQFNDGREAHLQFVREEQGLRFSAASLKAVSPAMESPALNKISFLVFFFLIDCQKQK